MSSAPVALFQYSFAAAEARPRIFWGWRRIVGYNPDMIFAMAAAALVFLPDGLEGKVASLLPTAEEEKWLTIPWHTDLNQARHESAQTSKPIFVWIMNGHPMGCT